MSVEMYCIEVLFNEIQISKTFLATNLTKQQVVNERLNIDTRENAASAKVKVPSKYWHLNFIKRLISSIPFCFL